MNVEVAKIIEDIEEGRKPMTAVPRMVHFGHTCLAAFEDEDSLWRCRFCNHEWKSQDGFKCPACNKLSDPPRYICCCGNEWWGKWGNFCSLCGKPCKGDYFKSLGEPRPTVYDVGPMPIINGRLVPLNRYHTSHHRVTVEYRGSNKWAICESRSCLSKDGVFEFEPMPSSRDEGFFNRTRFDSMMEAYDFYQKWRYAVMKWVERELAKGIEFPLNIPEDVLQQHERVCNGA